jgi:transposase
LYVYIDESGWNLHLPRRKGRAPVEENGSKGPNITLIAAVSPNFGLIHHVVRLGGTNRDVFSQFMADTLKACLTHKPGGKFVFILDNAKFHHSEDVKRVVPAPHCIEFNPPYSPFLNPIETIFSVWKNEIKLRREKGSDSEDLMVLVDRVVREITAEEVAAHCDHLSKFVLPCLEGQSIVGDAPGGAAPSEAELKVALDKSNGSTAPLPPLAASAAAVARPVREGSMDL